MKKILLVEGNLREVNQEFTDNGIKTHTESLRESIDYFTSNLEIDSDRYELLVTNKENINSSLKTIRTTDKGTVFWRLLVNTAEEIDILDNQRRTTVCEYR